MLNLNMPEPEFDEEEVQSFAKNVVAARMQKIEYVLKVLQAHADVVVETYVSLYTECSKDDLGKLLDLRGLGRTEKNAVFEKYDKLKPATNSPTVSANPSLAGFFKTLTMTGTN